MSRNFKRLNKMIARRARLQKEQPDFMNDISLRRHEVVKNLNEVIDNKPSLNELTGEWEKPFTTLQVNQAKNHLRKIYARTFATTGGATTMNKNDWRESKKGKSFNPAR